MKNVYSNVACSGMDVHYEFSDVTFRNEAGGVVRRERLDHRERERLRERVRRWPKGLPVVLEASFGWGWLSDVLEEAGLEPHLSNCYKVEQMRKARGWVKTNRKDADLVSLLPFEASSWWEVWRAPPAVRDQREQMRFRADLVALQTCVKNRIHAIFHRHGIFHDFSDLFGGQGRAFLCELCLHNPTGLPPQASLRGQVKLLDHVRRQLADVERVLHRQWVTTPLVRRLKTISGIGLVLAHVLSAEIGRIERFGNHKRLTSGWLPTASWRRVRTTPARPTRPRRRWVGIWAVGATARSSGPLSRPLTQRSVPAGGGVRCLIGSPRAAGKTGTAVTSKWRGNWSRWCTWSGSRKWRTRRFPRLVQAAARIRSNLVRERASSAILWSMPCRHRDLFVCGPPAPDEIV